jgi:hypothetical protein
MKQNQDALMDCVLPAHSQTDVMKDLNNCSNSATQQQSRRGEARGKGRGT